MIARKLLYLVLIVVFAPAFAFADADLNLLTKAAPGDWAEYSVTRQNETVPMLGFKDQKRWRAIRMVDEASVGIDEYMLMGDQRSAGLGRIVSLEKPFEPLAGLADAATVKVVSESADTIRVAGKNFACRKIERKIKQPLDDEKFQGKWEGTSTIWICPEVPLGGLVKMETRFAEQLMSSVEANKIVETWVLSDFGFKSWEDQSE